MTSKFSFSESKLLHLWLWTMKLVTDLWNRSWLKKQKALPPLLFKRHLLIPSWHSHKMVLHHRLCSSLLLSMSLGASCTHLVHHRSFQQSFLWRTCWEHMKNPTKHKAKKRINIQKSTNNRPRNYAKLKLENSHNAE